MLMKTAKKTGNPYIVHEVNASEIIDFKDYAGKTLNLRSFSWNNVKVIEVREII